MEVLEHSVIALLIADDHAMIRQGIRSWLEEERDITVVAETDNGESVPHLVSSHSPDVVLLDLHMGDVNGIDVVRKLRSSGISTPVLVMTGFSTRRVKAVLESGANGFLSKEESRENFREAVRWAAKKLPGTWVSPALAQELVMINTAISKAELTNTELRILMHIDKSNAEIASVLFLSEGTVRNNLSMIYSKLGVTHRTEAVLWARNYGILHDTDGEE